MMKSAQSIEDGFSFLGALFVGPGKYSVDAYMASKGTKSASGPVSSLAY